jgi:hypothetical protein
VLLDSRTFHASRRAAIELVTMELRKGNKVSLTFDTIGYLLRIHVTMANHQVRDHLEELVAAVQYDM